MDNFKRLCVSYVEFCAAHRLVIFPPDYQNIARYLTLVTTKVSAFGTMTNKLSGLSKFYNLSGHPINVHHPLIELLIKSCKREMSVSARPKAPLEPGHILLIAQILDNSDPYHRLFFVALVIQFFACLRKSNLLPPSLRAFSPFHHLTRGDIHQVPGALILTLPWAQNLQNNDDVITLPIADVPGALLNPVQTYLQFVGEFPLPSPRMPAFALIRAGKLLVLTQQNYINILKHYLTRLNIPAEAYSSHSVRRGGTTLLWRSGASQKQIKAHGGWSSQCYERYIDVSHADKLQSTHQMVSYINNYYGANQ